MGDHVWIGLKRDHRFGAGVELCDSANYPEACAHLDHAVGRTNDGERTSDLLAFIAGLIDARDACFVEERRRRNLDAHTFGDMCRRGLNCHNVLPSIFCFVQS